MYFVSITVGLIYLISIINKKWSEKYSSDSESVQTNATVINTNSTPVSVVSLKTEICDILNKKNFKYFISNEGQRFELNFNDEKNTNEPKKFLIEVSNEEKYVKFTTIVCSNVPPNSLSKIFELICRLNEHYILGHYNFLIEEGLVVFQAFLILNSKNFAIEDFDLYFAHIYDALDDSQKLFKSVIYNNEEPLFAMMSFYNK